jgi:hypothetical protein
MGGWKGGMRGCEAHEVQKKREKLRCLLSSPIFFFNIYDVMGKKR